MSVTIQRNDPCVCGSGKKYKKCCMNKEKVIQLKHVKEERFLQQKHALTLMLREFIYSKFSYMQHQKQFSLFKKRTKGLIEEYVEESFFDFWLYYFYRFENGLRGIEWFEKERGAKLSAADRQLVKQWTSLKPRLLEATGRTESVIQFSDVWTKETFTVKFPNQKLKSFAPWYGTLALLEPFDGHFEFHGINRMISPEDIQIAKREVEQWSKKTSQTNEHILFEYFPEILAATMGPEPHSHTHKDIHLYKVQAKVLDDEIVAEYFYRLEDLVIDEWNKTSKQGGFAKDWKVYRDTLVEGEIVLADVDGHLTIEEDELTYTSHHLEAKKEFMRKLKQVHMAITNVKEQIETITLPIHAELQTTMIKMGENVPPYVGLYVQSIGLIDVTQSIPKYDNLSLIELVNHNRAEDAERWLKQAEYHVYAMTEKEYGDVDFTADLNTVRKRLGLPLSPFVTEGANRFSQVEATSPQNQKPTPVSEEDIEVYEKLGFTPSTINNFYTNDIIDFYKKKTDGKGENTVRKYKNSLFDIREALEASIFKSWSEVDDKFWEKLIVFDFTEINGPASKSNVKEFLSTVKIFTKWLDKKQKTNIAKEVATFISTVEDDLIRAAELLTEFNPYQRYMNEAMEKMNDIAKMMRNIAEPYDDLLEGTFQVTKKNKASIKIRELDETGEERTVKMSANQLQYVNEGMFFLGEIGKKNAGAAAYEWVDLYQVYVKEAAFYLEIF
ncbi:SEC-C domain-containing protein [Halalkalibacter alkalisediminis]|uniref:SEC-C domain-containing protein n=1 Tax=Halalkalibacter alkalisediminis TaxID=935616 RepID=A0ABV6NLJ9_9BACI|nr:SEC-C domain-containing protein [Halalkalibacter alkalisediminis]